MTEHDRRGAVLIELVRRELELALDPEAPDDEPRGSEPDEPWLQEPGAVFVTLKRDGDLRGCVGSLVAARPLIDDVRHNAVAAATRDTRFPPLGEGELAEVEIEVTLLSAPVPMTFTCEADAVRQLRPGVDGVVLRHGPRRATYLPQVWDSLPDPQAFLASLKKKAGLAPDFWDDQIRLDRYAAQKWSESDLSPVRGRRSIAPSAG